MEGGGRKAALGPGEDGDDGMSGYQISIQPGHIARHTPKNAGAQGREAAVVDVAQDLLLRELYENGVLGSVSKTLRWLLRIAPRESVRFRIIGSP